MKIEGQRAELSRRAEHRPKEDVPLRMVYVCFSYSFEQNVCFSWRLRLIDLLAVACLVYALGVHMI